MCFNEFEETIWLSKNSMENGQYVATQSDGMQKI